MNLSWLFWMSRVSRAIGKLNQPWCHCEMLQLVRVTVRRSGVDEKSVLGMSISGLLLKFMVSSDRETFKVLS